MERRIRVVVNIVVYFLIESLKSGRAVVTALRLCGNSSPPTYKLIGHPLPDLLLALAEVQVSKLWTGLHAGHDVPEQAQKPFHPACVVRLRNFDKLIQLGVDSPRDDCIGAILGVETCDDRLQRLT